MEHRPSKSLLVERDQRVVARIKWVGSVGQLVFAMGFVFCYRVLERVKVPCLSTTNEQYKAATAQSAEQPIVDNSREFRVGSRELAT